MDLLTEDEAYDALGHSRDGSLVAIGDVIAGVTAAIEARIGPVIARTITEEHEPGARIVLRNRPVMSITTINGGPHVGRINRSAGILDHGTYTADASGWCVVVFVAGRCVDQDTIPGHIREAARLALRDLWRRDRSAFYGQPTYNAADPVAVSQHLLPLAAIQMIAHERQIAFA